MSGPGRDEDRTAEPGSGALRAARPPRVHREVVSFVRRSARMRPNQRRAWEAHHEHFVLPVPQRETSTSVDPRARLDLPAAFGRRAPLVVEIGPGPGDSLVAMAAARPEVDVLVFEVYEPAAAQLVGALHRAGLDNVRIVVADAAAGLRHLVPAAGLAELWTFFPDPWPKARHHKRRLVSPGLAALVTERLQPGGVWRLATDWEDYADAMRTVLDAEPGLENQHPGGWAPRWDARPLTRFEQRGLDAGRSVHDLTYRRGSAGAG
ncbi:MAG: tRNA (guanine(46)-N(7))-methyltransferase [uncultured Friedmanniella sp.]|uniref:tRNA (guanine-N(7)-)-methyltransferase n=1 Tax=uncultured Friedmanniella sp. TaxID=335381 RepID=A0A6J4KPV4_9ACTN|nr:MAG: tRNA (guanine(46)-N(7))-methyltransferase [uncultured Friedmanniella sp.]